MKTKFTILSFLTALIAPAITHAQIVATGAFDIGDILNLLAKWLVALPRLLVFAAIALILVQVVVFIYHRIKGDAGADYKEGFSKIITSIGLLILALSIWGIMAIVSSTFNLGVGGQINQDFIPSVDLSDIPPF